MINRTFLDNLLKTDSVSGNESKACDIVREYLEDKSSIHSDSIGNLYATINDGNEYKILIEAHIDEVGFQVNYIDTEGYVYLRTSGGIDLITAIGRMVCISTRNNGKIYGVIGKKPIHLLKGEEKTRIPEIEGIWVDTGLNYEEVSHFVSIGDYVSIYSEQQYIGDNKLVGKGLDNKLGVYVLSEVIKRLAEDKFKGVSVTALFSVQEEIGCKGAVVAALGNQYNEIISVDVTFTSDVPDISPKSIGDIRLGAGPVLFLHSDVNRTLIDDIAAHSGNTKIQMSANYAVSGGTDVRPLQLSTKKARTALIGLPLRYMHTPVEMCDLRDVENAVNIITKYIESKQR